VIFIQIEAFAWSFHSQRAQLAVGFDVEPDEHDQKKRSKNQTESLGFQAKHKTLFRSFIFKDKQNLMQ
jgi:hypothetical protein